MININYLTIPQNINLDDFEKLVFKNFTILSCQLPVLFILENLVKKSEKISNNLSYTCFKVASGMNSVTL